MKKIKIALFLLLMGVSFSLAYAAETPAEPTEAELKAQQCKAECSVKYSEAAKGCSGSSDPNCFQGAQQVYSACTSACPA